MLILYDSRIFQDIAKHPKTSKTFQNHPKPSKTIQNHHEDFPGDGDDAVLDSLLHESQVLEQHGIALDTMMELQMLGEPVPGDGNCALWSILALERGEPACLDGGKKIWNQIPMGAVRSMRKDSLYILSILEQFTQCIQWDILYIYIVYHDYHRIILINIVYHGPLFSAYKMVNSSI